MFEDDTDAEIGNYFRSNLLEVRKAVTQLQFKKFAALDSGAERVAFVLSYPQSRELSFEVENLELKSAVKALNLKKEGNSLFGLGDFPKALEKYSNAILLAPKEEVAVILGNRSAVLNHLEKHELAVRDADEAIKIGYPKELLYKLEERRARCFLVLKKHSRAIEAFRNALKALDDAKIAPEKRQKFESDIRMMLAVMERGNQLNQGNSRNRSAAEDSPIVENRDTQAVPRLQEVNKWYPACGKTVEIRDEGGDVGRHAIATRDIAPGELIAVEKPFASTLLAEYRLTHCHRCLSSIFAPIPASCYNCSSIAYCSIKCRDADRITHRTECDLLPALWLSSASVTCILALRAIIQKPFEELIKIRDQLKSQKRDAETAQNRIYKGNDYASFHSLVTHEDERTPDDLFHRAYIASWLLRLLKTTSYLPKNVKSPDTADSKLSQEELFIAELLLHNLQLLQFNSHEISELTRPKGQKTLAESKSVFVGGGVYPTVALFNHSCNPAVIRYFIGTTMIVRAIRSIPAGGEISENYGPIFTVMPETERQRKLRVQYWFDCTCEACSEHWPLLEEIDPTILRFKCETGIDCGNVLLVKSDTNEFMINCKKCNKSTNILKGLKTLQDTDSLFTTASKYLEKGDHESALSNYIKILKLLDETLALPIRDYHLCQQGVRLCLLALGNTAVK